MATLFYFYTEDNTQSERHNSKGVVLIARPLEGEGVWVLKFIKLNHKRTGYINYYEEKYPFTECHDFGYDYHYRRLKRDGYELMAVDNLFTTPSLPMLVESTAIESID